MHGAPARHHVSGSSESMPPCCAVSTTTLCFHIIYQCSIHSCNVQRWRHEGCSCLDEQKWCHKMVKTDIDSTLPTWDIFQKTSALTYLCSSDHRLSWTSAWTTVLLAIEKVSHPPTKQNCNETTFLSKHHAMVAFIVYKEWRQVLYIVGITLLFNAVSCLLKCSVALPVANTIWKSRPPYYPVYRYLMKSRILWSTLQRGYWRDWLHRGNCCWGGVRSSIYLHHSKKKDFRETCWLS